jgi:hypothetical protein
MRILLTKSDLEKIREKALENYEWIPYIEEYPNLRGVFSRKWGDYKNPKVQLKNFLNSFLYEKEIFLLYKMQRRDPIGINAIYFPLYKYKDFETAVAKISDLSPEIPTDVIERSIIATIHEIAKVYPQLKIQLYKTKSDFITIYPKVSEFLQKKIDIFYIHHKKWRFYSFENISLKNIDSLYLNSADNILYTREFVEFYLKHVRVFSRQDIFRICEFIGQKIIRKYHSDFYDNSKEEWKYLEDKIDKEKFQILKRDIFKSNSPSFHQYLLGIITFTEESQIAVPLLNLCYKYVNYGESGISIETVYNAIYNYFSDESGIPEKFFSDNLFVSDLEYIIYIYGREKPSSFIFDSEILFYTIPRGGLEFLGVFLYANNIAKTKYTNITKISLEIEEIIEQLILLKNKMKVNEIDYKEIVEEITDIIEELSDTTDEEKQIKTEIGVWGSIHHDNLDTIFLVDDYFISGSNIKLLYSMINRHFDRVIQHVQLELFSISKRRNIAKYIKGNIAYYGSNIDLFLTFLNKSFYGILTEDILAIYKLFPKIKKITNGEVDKVKLDNEFSIKYSEKYYSTEKNHFSIEYINKNWIDKLIITIALPHSIADGETENLLRMLYGERFRHSIRNRIIFLKNLLSLIKK